MDLRWECFSVKMCAKMKNLGSVGETCAEIFACRSATDNVKLTFFHLLFKSASQKIPTECPNQAVAVWWDLAVNFK